MMTLEIARTEQITACDWRFTEFVMRAWAEPELAARYSDDPVGTLAAFGMRIGSLREAPELRSASADGIVIEDLDHAAPVSAPFTYCG